MARSDYFKQILTFKNLVPLLSFLLMVISGGYLFFRDNPPQVAGIFNTNKPGTLRLVIPETVHVNVPFNVDVIVDSKNQNMNAVGFYLKFSPEHLTLLDFDTSQSFCQFYPERRFDNSVGTMTLACGSPHPGFSGENTLIRLSFMPRIVANTVLLVDPKSKILISDGKGTNILDEYPSAEISILNRL